MHRLDTDTSGCLLFARNAKARAIFQQLFEARAVEKFYLAVVAAEVREEAGLIDVSLAKTSSAEAGWRMVADPHGLPATTHWRRIAVRDGASLVEFRPTDGTHAPDPRACARGLRSRDRRRPRLRRSRGPMLLHASRLIVPREGKAAIDVTAPLPEYLRRLAQCGLRT